MHPLILAVYAVLDFQNDVIDNSFDRFQTCFSEFNGYGMRTLSIRLHKSSKLAWIAGKCHPEPDQTTQTSKEWQMVSYSSIPN